jgi:hypothetical protein
VPLLEGPFVLLDPGLDVVREGAPVGIQMNPGQGQQGAPFVGRYLAGAQHVKADADRAGLHAMGGDMALAQGGDVAFQRHVVRRRLRVDHHQVAGDPPPRPQAQGVGQRPQQAHALRRRHRDQDDGPIARDAEAPEQAPVADAAGALASRRVRAGRVRLSSKGVVSACTAAKFGGLMPRSRRRMPDRVADISEARWMWLGWWYLSITRVQGVGIVGGRGGEDQARVRAGRDAQAQHQCAHRIESGLEWMVPPGVVRSGCVGRLRREGARGWLTSWLRPSQTCRSAWALTLTSGLSDSARKCATRVARSVARRGVRAKTRAWCAACHRACTNRLPNAGWASSARGSANAISKAEISSISMSAVAGIAQLDLTKLDVVFRADPDGGAGLDVGPGGVEAGAVGMEGALVVRAGSGAGCRVTETGRCCGLRRR